MILLIPTFLLGGCAAWFGEPWPECRTLSECVRVEGKNSTHALYYRLDADHASVVFINSHGDRMAYRFDWPIEWGVVVIGTTIRTENGKDPRVIYRKYSGSF